MCLIFEAKYSKHTFQGRGPQQGLGDQEAPLPNLVTKSFQLMQALPNRLLEGAAGISRI